LEEVTQLRCRVGAHDGDPGKWEFLEMLLRKELIDYQAEFLGQIEEAEDLAVGGRVVGQVSHGSIGRVVDFSQLSKCWCGFGLGGESERLL
jgi:hypothetical protein